MKEQDYKTILRYIKLEHRKADLGCFPLHEMVSICKTSKYDFNTANGLTKAIIDYVRYRGGYANRINTTGLYRPELKRRVYSQTKKGTPDIDGLINGIPFKIEVKIGRDKMSPDQQKQKTAIQEAGGNYFIAKDFPSTYVWLNTLCGLEPISIDTAKRAFQNKR